MLRHMTILLSFSGWGVFCCVFFLLLHQWTLKMFPYVQFSRSVASDSLRPHGLQHARPPCPSPTPGTCSNSCQSSWWCHPALSSSYHPFLLPPSFFPSIRVFFNESVIHIRWPKYWSFSFSISPSSEYSGLPLGWTGLISLQSKGLSRVFSNTTVRRHQFFGAQLCLYYNSHIHIWLLEEPWLWLDEPLLAK